MICRSPMVIIFVLFMHLRSDHQNFRSKLAKKLFHSFDYFSFLHPEIHTQVLGQCTLQYVCLHFHTFWVNNGIKSFLIGYFTRNLDTNFFNYTGKLWKWFWINLFMTNQKEFQTIVKVLTNWLTIKSGKMSIQTGFFLAWYPTWQ